MENLPKEANEAISIIAEHFKPISIFAYGSFVSGDVNANSDVDLGVIFDCGKNGENEQNYKSRAKIRELLQTYQKVEGRKIAVYPFRLHDFKKYNARFPFQKNVFSAVILSGGASTVYGEDVVGNIKPPKLDLNDFLQDTLFELGVAFSAVQVAKSGDINVASSLFYRSHIYAIRNLVWATTSKLAIGFKQICEMAHTINIPEEYSGIFQTACQIREGNAQTISMNDFYKNISFINDFVIPSMRATAKTYIE